MPKTIEMRRTLLILSIFAMASGPMKRARATGGDLDCRKAALGFYVSQAEPFSNDLVYVIFRPSTPTRVLVPRRTVPNYFRRLRNAFQEARSLWSRDAEMVPIALKPNVAAIRKITNELSPYGEAVKKQMRGSTVIDLGSGNPSRSTVPRMLAELFQAKAYIGVDQVPVWGSRGRINEFGFHRGAQFKSTFVKSDMLEYLRNFRRPGDGSRVTFHLEGIEAMPGFEKETYEYLLQTMKRLEAIAQPGDGLILGHVVSFLHGTDDMPHRTGYAPIDPAKHGFRRAKTERMLVMVADDATTKTTFDVWVKDPSPFDARAALSREVPGVVIESADGVLGPQQRADLAQIIRDAIENDRKKNGMLFWMNGREPLFHSGWVKHKGWDAPRSRLNFPKNLDMARTVENLRNSVLKRIPAHERAIWAQSEWRVDIVREVAGDRSARKSWLPNDGDSFAEVNLEGSGPYFAVVAEDPNQWHSHFRPLQNYGTNPIESFELKLQEGEIIVFRPERNDAFVSTCRAEGPRLAIRVEIRRPESLPSSTRPAALEK